MKQFFQGLVGLFLLCMMIQATAETPTTMFAAGKDYEIITNNADIPSFPSEKVTVMEFFSYGCPWCYELEPQLQQWVHKKPNYVIFTRAPVVFEKNWDYYAKAYYVAQALGIEPQITPKLFNAIQEQDKALASNKAMENFFSNQGIKRATAESAFEASPTLDEDIKQGPRLMQAYQVYVIPAIVVDGKYRTDMRMALDNKRLIQIVQFLIEKRKAEKKIS